LNYLKLLKGTKKSNERSSGLHELPALKITCLIPGNFAGAMVSFRIIFIFRNSQGKQLLMKRKQVRITIKNQPFNL